MTKPWYFHPEAHEELVEVAEYYEQKKPGLGEAFARRVEACLNQLESAPTSAAAVPQVAGELKVRRGFVSRFPYALVFVELESEFQIVAVAHLHRRPGYWGLRLKRLAAADGRVGPPLGGARGGPMHSPNLALSPRSSAPGGCSEWPRLLMTERPAGWSVAGFVTYFLAPLGDAYAATSRRLLERSSPSR